MSAVRPVHSLGVMGVRSYWKACFVHWLVVEGRGAGFIHLTECEPYEHDKLLVAFIDLDAPQPASVFGTLVSCWGAEQGVCLAHVCES